MSLPQTIDEIPMRTILKELRRRSAMKDAGRCDYCERPLLATPLCKFPDRHMGNEKLRDE